MNFLDDLDFGDAHFEAARRTLLGANFASNDDARFLRQAPSALPNASGFSLSAQTPWMMPVPSRKMGNISLPDSRRL